MNITRHNYEEYFILYMDNELGSDDRRLVEAFVQQHPDLKDELDLLFQYKLIPDTHIVFDAKEELMKVNGDAPVTLSNYDEWIMLYIDNELTLAQKIKVELFIAANPAVNEEFLLLQRTKLQSEEIVFADKASLYRKEEKVRPMPIRWWRIAAAVLLLGIGITTALVLNKKPAGENEKIVKGAAPEKKMNIAVSVVTPEETNNPVNESIVADNNKQVLPSGEKQTTGTNLSVREKNTMVKNQLLVYTPAPLIKEEPVVVTNNKITNDLPLPLNNPNINKNDATNKAVASDNTPKENKQKDALTNSIVTSQNPQSSDIVNASFTNNNDAELDQPNDKKNKSRGLFRKIARTFEKRTNIDPTDDNKLLVAGLAIRLK